MANTAMPEVRPDIERDEKSKSESARDPGYVVICWNDPVNLMDYVTHVFQTVFAWQRPKAEFHMKQVHNAGKSVLIRESLEKAGITCISSRNTACTPPWSGTSETATGRKRALFYSTWQS